MRFRAPSTLALVCFALVATGCGGSGHKAAPKGTPTASRPPVFAPVPGDVQAARKANLTGSDFPKQEAWLATRLQPRASQDRLVLACLKQKALRDVTADVESSLYSHRVPKLGQAVSVIGEIAVKKTGASATADLKLLASTAGRTCLQQVLAKSLLESIPRTVEAVGVVAKPGKAPAAAGAGAVAYDVAMTARSGNRSRRLALGEITFFAVGRAVVTINEIATGGAVVPASLTTSLAQALRTRLAKGLK